MPSQAAYMASSGSDRADVLPERIPPSENTVAANVTHEILSRANSRGFPVMTAIEPSRSEEGEGLDYDTLPDPRPRRVSKGESSYPQYRRRAVAIQFKSIETEASYPDQSRIGSFRSGDYLKISIDTGQLRDIRDPAAGVSYGRGELFYALPSISFRLAEPQYLGWTIFVDAFDLPQDAGYVYIPIYLCPGADFSELTIDQVEHFDDLLSGAGSRTVPHNFEEKLRSDAHAPLYEIYESVFELLTDFKRVYAGRVGSRADYSTENPIVDLLDEGKSQVLPGRYGVFARPTNTTEATPINAHLLNWNDIQGRLQPPNPEIGVELPARTVRPDGGEDSTSNNKNNVDNFTIPDGWRGFVATFERSVEGQA
jgi:hypothetical protein